MRQQILTIPETPKSLNVLLGMHYMARSKYKQELNEMIGWEIKRQKIKPVKQCTLRVAITFDNKHKHDLDNYIAGLKWPIDSLRYAGILPEDNSEVVKEISCEFRRGSERKTEIIITEE